MGKYLDLANSGVSGGARQRELPARGDAALLASACTSSTSTARSRSTRRTCPIPTYTQTDVQQLAKALTGWTYGNATGHAAGLRQLQLLSRARCCRSPAKHNTSAKTILGQTLPANQTIQQDLDGAIDIIFNHPNVGPFLATRLIRALVTSNPSPAYIARVAAVFNDNGAGVRGDMKAVIRAILLDPEARNDTPPATFGRLRTPMQHTIALARALGLEPRRRPRSSPTSSTT